MSLVARALQGSLSGRSLGSVESMASAEEPDKIGLVTSDIRSSGFGSVELLFGADFSLWSYPSGFLRLVTPKTISITVAHHIRDLMGDQIHIGDLFAGIGSDCISYLQTIDNSLASVIEINYETYCCLVTNIHTFNLHTRIKYYQESCVQWLERLEAKCSIEPIGGSLVLFFDPPWGIDYNPRDIFYFERLSVSANKVTPWTGETKGDIDLMQLADRCLAVSSMVVFKSPINSNSFESRYSSRIMRVLYFSFKNLKFIMVRGDNYSLTQLTIPLGVD